MTTFALQFNHALLCSFFFLNDPAPPEIYTLSLHDALPIYLEVAEADVDPLAARRHDRGHLARRADQLDAQGDRKSTRLNSSHVEISYAVFCLKKKNLTSNANKRIYLQKRHIETLLSSLSTV